MSSHNASHTHQANSQINQFQFIDDSDDESYEDEDEKRDVDSQWNEIEEQLKQMLDPLNFRPHVSTRTGPIMNQQASPHIEASSIPYNHKSPVSIGPETRQQGLPCYNEAPSTSSVPYNHHTTTCTSPKSVTKHGQNSEETRLFLGLDSRQQSLNIGSNTELQPHTRLYEQYHPPLQKPHHKTPGHTPYLSHNNIYQQSSYLGVSSPQQLRALSPNLIRRQLEQTAKQSNFIFNQSEKEIRNEMENYEYSDIPGDKDFLVMFSSVPGK